MRITICTYLSMTFMQCLIRLSSVVLSSSIALRTMAFYTQMWWTIVGHPSEMRYSITNLLPLGTP